MANAKAWREPEISRNLEMERDVQGSVLINPPIIHELKRLLRPGKLGEFSLPQNQVIWGAYLEVANRGDLPDIETVIDYLKEHGQLEAAGGAEYVFSLDKNVRHTVLATQWAYKLLEHSAKRAKYDLARAYAQASQTDDATAIAEVERQKARLEDIERRMRLKGNENNENNENTEDEPDENSLNSLNSWPKPMRDEAFIGPIGHFVLKIAPYTEAAPEALLIQGLVAAGNAMGRSAYCVAEADEHHTNLYAVIVAGTGARKGTSWGQDKRFLKRATPEWVDGHIIGGLSSGEGLINAVRDDEPGIPDKVVLAYEPEFASVFKVKGRDGNTLSTVLRQGWDGSTLASLTRQSPLKATGTHISLIGHITPEELRQQISATDAHNGFANRILWVCAKRARFLPDGGDVDSVNLNLEVMGLQGALAFAKSAGRMRRDDEASKLWSKVYQRLTTPRAGVLGLVTGRAEAQVLRLSLLYALLDRSPMIAKKHLEAALAVWDYCVASAGFIFGTASGNRLADTLHELLCERAPAGMTRTEISQHFGRNKSKEEIAQALGTLEGQGLVQSRREIGNGGRTITRWYAMVHENDENGQRCPACGGDDLRTYGHELRCFDCGEMIAEGGAK